MTAQTQAKPNASLGRGVVKGPALVQPEAAAARSFFHLECGSRNGRWPNQTDSLISICFQPYQAARRPAIEALPTNPQNLAIQLDGKCQRRRRTRRAHPHAPATSVPRMSGPSGMNCIQSASENTRSSVAGINASLPWRIVAWRAFSAATFCLVETLKALCVERKQDRYLNRHQVWAFRRLISQPCRAKQHRSLQSPRQW